MWHRRFICLWAGQTLANLGDVFYIVAFISVIYAATGSVMYTAFIPVVIVTAQSVSGLLAPLLFNRLSLPSMLVLSQGLKTIFLAAASIAVASGVSEHKEWGGLLFGLGSLIAFMDGWANPARNAMVPQLVGRDDLLRANSLLATSDQIVHFAGWAAGGMLVAWLGADLVLWGTVAAYVVATIAMLGIAPAGDRPREHQETHSTNWLTGWRVIRDVPVLRQLVVIDVVIGMSGGVWIAAIMLPFVIAVLGQGEEWWGYINAGYMLGAIVGGSVVLMCADRMSRHLFRWIVCGTIGVGLFTYFFGSTTTPLLALLFSFALGPFMEMMHVSKQTLLQQATEEAALPYVLSAKGTIELLVFGASSLMMGAFAEWQGVRAVYDFSAGLLFVAFLLAWRLQKKHMEQTSENSIT